MGVGDVSDLVGISTPNMAARPRPWERYESHGNALMKEVLYKTFIMLLPLFACLKTQFKQ